MKIGLWSTTAGNNNSSPPDGWPEGQAPSTVNDCARELMAQVRTYTQSAEWFDHALSPTYVNATTFTVPGDQSSILHSKRQLKLFDATTRYDAISTVSVSANTNVVLTGAVSITASLSSFAVAIISNSNSSLPYGVLFPSGTRMPFAQAAAPTGWTQATTDNETNRMLRVVNTAGGGVAGTHSPILNNVVPAHSHSGNTGNNSVDHTHSGTTGTMNSNTSHAHGIGGGGTGFVGTGLGSGNTSGGSTIGSTANTDTQNIDHTHNFTTGGTSATHYHGFITDNGSSQTNWQPRYIDMIICSRN